MFILNVHNPNRWARQGMAAARQEEVSALEIRILNGFEGGPADQIFQAMVNSHKTEMCSIKILWLSIQNHVKQFRELY
jgi:hypothetical protein